VVETDYRIEVNEFALEAEELDGRLLHGFNHPKRNAKVAKTWRPEFGQTLAFAIDIDHANGLARAFVDAHPKIPIQVVHSGSLPASVPSVVRPSRGEPLSREDRRCIHDLFRRGEIRVLVAVNIYTMGVDFPQVETLFMARPTLSPVLYAQMLGRGLRGPAFGGKETVRVVDFADQSDTHAHLAERIMHYQRERSWLEKRDADVRNVRRLMDRTKRCRPSEAADTLRGQAGVYRVTRRSGVVRERREWRWIRDLGMAVGTGLRERAIQYDDVVTFLPEDDDRKGTEYASLLRLAQKLGWTDDRAE
jgi:superfamily II DNA or RNA helicase